MVDMPSCDVSSRETSRAENPNCLAAEFRPVSILAGGRWRSPVYCPTGYVCPTEQRNRQDILTKGVEELVNISWWILEDSGSGTSPASHQKGRPNPLRRQLCMEGCCQWGIIESENYTVDRHGRSAVMLSVMKCSFGGVLVRETRFSFSEERVCVWVGRQEAY